MGQFSVDQLEQVQAQTSNNKDFAKVGYFNSLKDDKNEALVRFVYSNPKEFDLFVVHTVKVNNMTRYISCLRNGNDPMDKCPLCNKGDKVKSRFFIKLIEYVKDEKGNNIPVAKVWDRPASFAKELMVYFKDYPDLRDVVFRVTRNGVKGDTQTKYTLVAPNQQIYNEQLYPKDFSAFENFDLSKHSYYALTYDEINSFIMTGQIPQKETTNATQNNANNNNVNQNVGGQPGAQAYAQQNYNDVSGGIAQAQQQLQFAEQNPYGQQPQPGFTGGTVQGVNPPYQPPFSNQQNYGTYQSGYNPGTNQGINQGTPYNSYSGAYQQQNNYAQAGQPTQQTNVGSNPASNVDVDPVTGRKVYRYYENGQ